MDVPAVLEMDVSWILFPKMRIHWYGQNERGDGDQTLLRLEGTRRGTRQFHRSDHR